MIPVQKKRLTWRKRVVWIAFILMMLIFLPYLLLRNNVHTVLAGKLYRSAQLTPGYLRRLIQQDHIRTIINLRGANPQFNWYRDEVSVSHVMGVEHYDIAFSAHELPELKQLQRLIALFQIVPKPILIHCASGADRTGFATAMWLLMNNHSLAEARHAFSMVYFVHRSDSVGKQVIALYDRWLKQHRYKNNTTHFMTWVATTQLRG